MQVLGDAGMGWSDGNMSESVDGVGSGTLAGSTCIGNTSCHRSVTHTPRLQLQHQTFSLLVVCCWQGRLHTLSFLSIPLLLTFAHLKQQSSLRHSCFYFFSRDLSRPAHVRRCCHSGEVERGEAGCGRTGLVGFGCYFRCVANTIHSLVLISDLVLQ